MYWESATLNAVEIAILNGLADGLQSKEIASRVSRSKATVESYIQGLYSKLNARSRAQLVFKAVKAQIIPLDADAG